MRAVFMLSRCLVVGLLLLGGLNLPGAARADVFHLASGGRVEGELVNPGQNPRTAFVVRTRSGGTVTLDKRQVASVETASENEKLYRRMLVKMPSTVEGHWTMAEFCRTHHLPDAREYHLKSILELHPDHAEARHGLGYNKVDGRWVKTDEYMRSRGYVLHRGSWRLPQELAIEERRDAFEQAQRDWKRKLKMWRNWLGKKRGDEGLREIQAVDDWMAAEAAAEMLDDENTREGKQLWIDVLGKLPTHAAWTALVKYALEDDDAAIRDRCLSKLEQSGTRPAVGVFLRALDDKDNVRVNRAAIGLARMQDETVVPALIEHLVTRHRVLQQAPTGGSLGPIGTSFSPGGGAGLNAGGGPKVVDADVYNQNVREALIALTRESYTSQDEWRDWYVQSHTPAGVDLRRDD